MQSAAPWLTWCNNIGCVYDGVHTEGMIPPIVVDRMPPRVYDFQPKERSSLSGITEGIDMLNLLTWNC